MSPRSAKGQRPRSSPLSRDFFLIVTLCFVFACFLVFMGLDCRCSRSMSTVILTSITYPNCRLPPYEVKVYNDVNHGLGTRRFGGY
ncbi:hypothetical protein E4T56_gene1689 [Termitomyces sp. T112]|nr:hypothetical protein E4T56_gene1689 [Termitomyces sp. T112]